MSVAVEIKGRGEIDGVEKLTRYLELLNRDRLLAPVQRCVRGQQIRPRPEPCDGPGIRCVTLDHDDMRGVAREQNL